MSLKPNKAKPTLEVVVQYVTKHSIVVVAVVNMNMNMTTPQITKMIIEQKRAHEAKSTRNRPLLISAPIHGVRGS